MSLIMGDMSVRHPAFRSPPEKGLDRMRGGDNQFCPMVNFQSLSNMAVAAKARIHAGHPADTVSASLDK